MARLEDHEQDSVDPHGAVQEQTTKLRTPMIDAAADLNLLPDDEGAVIVGDTSAGGLYRPLVVADQAGQTIGGAELVKIWTNRAPTAVEQFCMSAHWEPVYSGNDYPVSTIDALVAFVGANKAYPAHTKTMKTSLIFNGSAGFGDYSSVHPMCALDVNIGGQVDFSGTVADAAGIVLHPWFMDDDASGTFGKVSMIRGLPGLKKDGNVGSFYWIDLPAVAHATNAYHFGLDAGKWEVRGGQLLVNTTASNIPFIIEGAASQSVNLQEWQDSNGSVLAAVNQVGNICVYGGAISLIKASAANRINVGIGDSNQNSHINLISDTTYTDYGLRIIRTNGGANTSSQILHRGSGNLQIIASDNGGIVIGSTTSQKLGFYGATPLSRITCSGTAPQAGSLIESVCNALKSLGLITF
jgi:hypothetical protein